MAQFQAQDITNLVLQMRTDNCLLELVRFLLWKFLQGCRRGNGLQFWSPKFGLDGGGGGHLKKN